MIADDLALTLPVASASPGEVNCHASEVDELEVSHGTIAEMFQKPPPG